MLKAYLDDEKDKVNIIASGDITTILTDVSTLIRVIYRDLPSNAKTQFKNGLTTAVLIGLPFINFENSPEFKELTEKLKRKMEEGD